MDRFLSIFPFEIKIVFCNFNILNFHLNHLPNGKVAGTRGEAVVCRVNRLVNVLYTIFQDFLIAHRMRSKNSMAVWSSLLVYKYSWVFCFSQIQT